MNYQRVMDAAYLFHGLTVLWWGTSPLVSVSGSIAWWEAGRTPGLFDL